MQYENPVTHYIVVCGYMCDPGLDLYFDETENMQLPEVSLWLCVSAMWDLIELFDYVKNVCL